MQDISTLQAERQQLVTRVAEIDALIEAASFSSTEYAVIEHTVTEFGSERSAWRVTHNGVPVTGHEYRDRQIAEDIATGLAAIPDDYSLTYEQIGRLGWRYLVRRNGRRITDSADIQRVITLVLEDVADRPRRAALAAERKAEAEAQAAAEKQAAAEAAERAKYATPRQVDFILTLLAEREFRAFPDPGFIIDGPTERAAIEKLTKEQASAYISSLKGDY